MQRKEKKRHEKEIKQHINSKENNVWESELEIEKYNKVNIVFCKAIIRQNNGIYISKKLTIINRCRRNRYQVKKITGVDIN